MDYIWNNIEHKVSTKLLEFINWYSKYVFSLLKLQITIIYRINLKKNFSSSILWYAIIRWIIRFSRYILFTYFLSKFKLWKLTIQGLAQIKPNSASATVKLHDLLNNVRGSFKSNPEQFKEISSDACSLVYRFQVSPSRRGVQRKSSFIPVRGFTLPRSPIYSQALDSWRVIGTRDAFIYSAFKQLAPRIGRSAAEGSKSIWSSPT